MSSKRPNILVVDDDPEIRRALASILSVRSYGIVFAESGQEAISLASECSPDLVILDLSLPGLDGMDVCRELRQWLHVPIIVLSVRSDPREKIQALDLGADDYLCKPFVAGELLARIRALLRRSTRGADGPQVLSFRSLELDFARRKLMREGKQVHLTPKEFDILALLARNPDRVVTVANILRSIWGPEYIGDVMSLRVHIGNLRKKIEDDPALPRFVTTEPGVGYMFVLGHEE